MQGQWSGRYESQTPGTIVVNVDERRTHFQGVAYLIPTNQAAVPMSVIRFQTINKDSAFSFQTTDMQPLHPGTQMPVEWESIKAGFAPDASMSRQADVVGTFSKDTLTLSWSTDIGLKGSCKLPRSKAGEKSELIPKKLNWRQYKQHISTLEDRRDLFRGQSAPWRLRTTFHRSGRANLERFLNDDVPTLHRNLSARTRHIFDLEVPKQNGAFFSLIQHHGYPTPLLDWTYSPYVAAFFAYRSVTKEKLRKARPADKVRIFTFDVEKWLRLRQDLAVVLPRFHVSVASFLAIENERMLPQQAVSLLTNVDDIETYIRGVEDLLHEKYLVAIDLPLTERDMVMHELRYMGITAGAMFPGLDGACEELKERNFG